VYSPVKDDYDQSIYEDGVVDPFADESYKEKNEKQDVDVEKDKPDDDDNDSLKTFLVVGLVVVVVLVAIVALACICQRKRMTMRETFANYKYDTREYGLGGSFATGNKEGVSQETKDLLV